MDSMMWRNKIGLSWFSSFSTFFFFPFLFFIQKKIFFFFFFISYIELYLQIVSEKIVIWK
jgi:hypothetical protein